MYMLTIVHCVGFFPEKRGLISGIIIAGFGLGNFTFSFVARDLMNKENFSIKGNTKAENDENLKLKAEEFPGNF